MSDKTEEQHFVEVKGQEQRQKVLDLLRELGVKVPDISEVETLRAGADVQGVLASDMEEKVRAALAQGGPYVRAFHTAGARLDNLLTVVRGTFLSMACLPLDQQEERAHEAMHDLLEAIGRFRDMTLRSMPCQQDDEGGEGSVH